MNDFDIDKLQNGKHFLFLTSTAGQGEFPRNAKSFYESLSKLKEGSLSDIVYGVFGLGDHGYVNFNKAAKDLEKMLRVLGGNNLLAMGLETTAMMRNTRPSSTSGCPLCTRPCTARRW